MGLVTFVTANCAAIGGPTLNIFGSDMDVSRLMISNSAGVNIGINIISSSPILIEVSTTGGFVNGNYAIGFIPYLSETFLVTVACPTITLNGLYIVNQAITNRRDAYLTTANKIPNPTIRTALLGE